MTCLAAICHLSLIFHGDHMYFVTFGFLCILTMSAMSSDENDFSLSGLTQQDPLYREVSVDSSDDGLDNLQLLFESARKLAGGEIQDFEDAVFDIGMSTSQTQSSVVTSLEVSADKEDMPRPSKRLRYSEGDHDSDIEVCYNFFKIYSS